MRKVKFFHVSPKRLRVGTGLSKGLGMFGSRGVFLTTSPIPHYTKVDEILNSTRPWHVYEVEPYGWIVYGACWDEAIAEFGTILRYIGTAKGILHNSRNQSGSMVTQSQIAQYSRRGQF